MGESERTAAAKGPDVTTGDIDRRVLRSSAWVAVSYGGRQILAFATTLILVRFLEPEAFGLVAIALVFLMFVEQAQGSGVGAALIHRRDSVEQAAASALVFMACAALVMYGVSFAAAPIAASLFDAPDLTPVLRVLAVLMVIRGFAVVPWAIIEREIDFRTRAKIELSAGATQILVAVPLAVSGSGVWSLVFGQLAASLVECSLAWLYAPWRPTLRLASWDVLREMIRYGRFVGANHIIILLAGLIDTLLISRLLSVGAVGYWSVTIRLATFPTVVIGYIVGRVMFPVYSIFQSDVAMLRGLYMQNLQRIALLALPLSVALIVSADPIVRALFGEDWLVVVPVLRILAIYSLVRSFVGTCNEVWKGMGKPHLGLAFSIPDVLLRIPLFFVLIGVLELEGAALALATTTLVIGLPALGLTFRLLGLGVADVFRALAPSAFCSALLGVSLLLLHPAMDALSPLATLALLAAAGLVVYAGATAVFARNIVMPMWANFRGSRA